MSLEYKKVKKNTDGSKTEKVRYSDGSGHCTKYRDGFFGKKIESSRKYPAKN